MPIRRRQTPWVLAAAFAACVGVLGAGAAGLQANQAATTPTPPSSDAVPPPKVGDLAPDFELKDPAGKTVRLSSLRGKVVVLDFWATWCVPCRRIAPVMQQLHDEFKDQGVLVYGLATQMDRPGDPVKFKKDNKYTYGLLLEADAVAKQFGVTALPTVVVVDKEGKVALWGTGARTSFLAEIRAVTLKAAGIADKPAETPTPPADAKR